MKEQNGAGPQDRVQREAHLPKGSEWCSHGAEVFRVQQHYYCGIVVRMIIKPCESTNLLETLMETTHKED